MMFCGKCGNEIDASDAFCRKCGTKIEAICSDCSSSQKDANTTKPRREIPTNVLYWVIGIAAAILLVNILVLSGAFHTHTIEETVLKAASCAAEGLKRKSCSTCDYTAEVIIPILEHDWEKETIIKKPSCTAEGLTKKRCSTCDYAEEIKTPALGHNWEYVRTIQRESCFFDGLMEYQCTNCNQTDKKTILAHHTMDGRKCKYCSYTEPLPELSIGMTKSQVKYKWGEPIDIDKSVSDRGTRERWWYKDNGNVISVNFGTDGKVESIIY